MLVLATLQVLGHNSVKPPPPPHPSPAPTIVWGQLKLKYCQNTLSKDIELGEGWAAWRCLAGVWVSRLRDSSPVSGLMSADQYNNSAALHTVRCIHQHHSLGSLSSSELLL